VQAAPGTGGGGPASTTASAFASAAPSLPASALPLEPLDELELELELEAVSPEELELDEAPESSVTAGISPPPSALQPVTSCAAATLPTANTNRPVFHLRMVTPLDWALGM